MGTNWIVIAMMCRKKKYKIKEIKRCLREKRISEVLREGERKKERKTVRSSITVDLSPYRIFEIRVRVTSSGRISLITRQENTSTPERKSYLILHKVQGAMLALTFSYTASHFRITKNNRELRSSQVTEFHIRWIPRQRKEKI